jgi:hypothetical protein
MSIVEELGAQVRAATEELPVDLVSVALDRFKAASDRLRWVRQESADPMGVPELSAATEHAESAGAALRVAQEQFASYLASLGLARDGAPGTPADRPSGKSDRPEAAGPPPEATRRSPGGTAYQWWPARVAELTGHKDNPDTGSGDRITDSEELLRRVAGGVRRGDRDQLHAALRRADADVGLGLAAIAPPMLRGLATELLGHPPKAPDLPRLRREFGGKVRALLPGLPPAVLDTLLTRVCRMPPQRESTGQTHPADPAVAAGVLTGLLLDRVGHPVEPAGAPGSGKSDG